MAPFESNIHCSVSVSNQQPQSHLGSPDEWSPMFTSLYVLLWSPPAPREEIGQWLVFWLSTLGSSYSTAEAALKKGQMWIFYNLIWSTTVTWHQTPFTAVRRAEVNISEDFIILQSLIQSKFKKQKLYLTDTVKDTSVHHYKTLKVWKSIKDFNTDEATSIWSHAWTRSNR